ncbi:O-acyltransferase domain containing protein, putative [Entamoeba invadens IP1]|uniref:O-acyltransferase domain containing protein, putative n=1 Tax=Entamoeba invadens IP1 TaxID=370355 RepID=A0A0A1U1J3_ENTIV|nr:O-acyltransferase domain containing protein, putative [Entamoeba invadens IP1]ELP87882.1 O-acyltransferase domain containing protein, putative [Entamoeba invadens IP1]|eukprot:XP_004254653.1 O-acyltransferase domain containing protein, putative [Entamoeba invadens IP1]
MPVLPPDQLRYLLAFLIELPLCYIYRFLPPNENLKHFVYGLTGVFLLFYVYEEQMLITLIPACITFFVMRTNQSIKLAIALFLSNMAFLTTLQIYKYYTSYLQWKLDIATLQMIVVIKLSSFAFNVAKGHNPSITTKSVYNTNNNITPKEFPTLLQFFGYFYFFPACFSGPCLEYKTYSKFVSLDLFKCSDNDSKESSIEITNNQYKDTQSPKLLPIDWSAAFIVTCQIIVLAGLTIIALILPLKQKFYEIVIDKKQHVGFLGRMVVTQIFMYSTVFRYFASWKLAELSGVVMGFGFSGYQNGVATWENYENVKLKTFCLSRSCKEVIGGWNCYVQSFFKNHVYEAFKALSGLTDRYKQTLTNLTSALWHGVYPGYYLAFGMLALHNTVSAKFSYQVEPFIIKKYGETSILYKMYLVITFLYTRVAITYSFVPFMIYTFEDSWKFFVSTYFFIDVIAVLALLLIKLFFTKEIDASKKEENSNLASENREKLD